ncbi:hypothetical protein UFOVP1492_101 [uncultured Caudovirales phage]|uniref:Uncharacterized protein n=1 Tax=uncultured Caudovirales phage TaxID=2100421 RepID=A0A6J5QN28_9CAUD|nr:hypothetical protein UFOVP1127_33 [uncultured Caudovirales phage]CAB4193210.1 hypothetical protein UFOVP1242_41 [uncultured Caudovirales phage]CAB4217833.1 hypothetical protein UFOVP1492_101 [uncultured Caudovirales phage]CAB5231648.1 hypothetical protein UFOVP1580_130 [uncultured Caudovirales phage]
MTTTTGGQLYFIALATLERLEIQFYPPELDFTNSLNIATVNIVGRNTPEYHYLSGESQLSMALDFYAMDGSVQDVIAKCLWLKALAMNDGDRRPAQQVKLVWGSLFPPNAKWIIRKFDYKLSLFDPANGNLPKQAYAQLTLALDPDSNIGWEDIRGDFKGPYPGLVT